MKGHCLLKQPASKRSVHSISLLRLRTGLLLFMCLCTTLFLSVFSWIFSCFFFLNVLLFIVLLLTLLSSWLISLYYRSNVVFKEKINAVTNTNTDVTLFKRPDVLSKCNRRAHPGAGMSFHMFTRYTHFSASLKQTI